MSETGFCERIPKVEKWVHDLLQNVKNIALLNVSSTKSATHNLHLVSQKKPERFYLKM